MVSGLRWLALALVALAGAPAGAAAARVEVDDNQSNGNVFVGYAAAPGERNDVRYSITPEGETEFSDQGAPLEAGHGCTAIDEHRARCRGKGIANVDLFLGDEDDRYTADLPPFTGASVRGEEGDDVLIGGAGTDSFTGGPGADLITGGGGHNDSYSVTSVYGQAETAHVTLDGRADDGLPGEGDNVGADIEEIFGGAGDDTIIGTDASNQIVDTQGNNTLQGAGGNDRITGSGTLAGGLGDDVLTSSGNGRVDNVSCGGGQDYVTSDADDVVAEDCTYKEVPGRPFAHFPVPSVAPVVTVPPRPATAPVPITCPADASQACQGQITLTRVVASTAARASAARSSKVGARSFVVSAGRTASVRVGLTRYGRRLMVRSRRVKLVAQVQSGAQRLQSSLVLQTRRSSR